MAYLHLPLLHIFHLVAEKGSFQSAATELNLPRSSISKKIRQLEEYVGQPLLKRSTRQLHLTDVGESLLAGTQELKNILNNMHGVVDASHEVMKGEVKISASILMGQRFIIPILGLLRQAYPDISVDLSLTDSKIDLLTERVDIAIRIGELPDSNLTARKIGVKEWGWFAAPCYLETHGVPKFPHDLSQHDCLVFHNSGSIFNKWPFQNKKGELHCIDVKPIVKTDNSRALVDMAIEGLGVIMVDPNFIKEEIHQAKLEPILSEWGHPEVSPISLVCTGQRTKVVDAVWQFLLRKLTAE